MTDSVFTSFGALDLPVSDEDVSGSLVSLDPARDRLLAWFAAAINAEFQSVWTEVLAALPSGHGLGANPVADTLPFEPTPRLMKERKAAWPLLALHRTGSPTFESLTLEDDRMTQNWQAHYILGPMDLEKQRRLLDLPQAIAKMLAVSIRCFGHPSYESGANQIEAADLESLELVNMSGPGAARFDGDEDSTTYWAMSLELRSTENTEPNNANDQFLSGIDLTLNVGGAGSPSINPALIEAQTDEDPNAL